VLPPLHQLLVAHRRQVTSALAAAFDDAVQLLPDEVRQQRSLLPEMYNLLHIA
jgi:hypothetical protein